MYIYIYRERDIIISIIIVIIIIITPPPTRPQQVTHTPSPPIKSFPTKSPRVELSGRLPKEFNGHEDPHPLELRVCLSQTL